MPRVYHPTLFFRLPAPWASASLATASNVSSGTIHVYRTDSRFAPSQWETALLCNGVSHWLGANLESANNLLPQLPPPPANMHTDRAFTEIKRSSIWQHWDHWWHCKLSLRQLTVLSMTTKWSQLRPFVFSVSRFCCGLVQMTPLTLGQWQYCSGVKEATLRNMGIWVTRTYLDGWYNQNITKRCAYFICTVCSVKKIRKNIYTSDIQVTFELCGHFWCLQVLYSN